MRTNFDQIEEVISELSMLNKSGRDTGTIGSRQTFKEAAPMLEGTASNRSRKRYNHSPSNNPLGSIERSNSGPLSPSMNQSIDQIRVPKSGGNFDTLLKRASQQRQSMNSKRDRSHREQDNAINLGHQALSSELYKIQAERDRFISEKEAWSIEKSNIKKRDMDQIQLERERLIQERESWQVKNNEMHAKELGSIKRQIEAERSELLKEREVWQAEMDRIHKAEMDKIMEEKETLMKERS